MRSIVSQKHEDSNPRGNLTFFAAVLEIISDPTKLFFCSLQDHRRPKSIKVKPCALVVDEGRGTLYFVPAKGDSSSQW